MTAPATGLLASFADPEALNAAAQEMRSRGHQPIDAYTPYPVKGLAERLGGKRSRIPVYAFIGGALGAAAILGLQLYSTTVNYPVNVGGRPLASWTAFAVPAFECTILGAALVAFFGMLIGNGLPRLHHPIFDAPSFSFADEDRFYLLVSGHDPSADLSSLRNALRDLHALSIEEVTL
jgi:hypothetical protein